MYRVKGSIIRINDMKFNNLINMTFSYGQPDQITDLRKFIYSKTERTSFRFWVISPFIGSLPFLSQMFHFDRLKRFQTDIDIRLITDINNLSLQNYETIRFFADYGQINTLTDLHAKMYIIDNEKIITSANFTRKAFMCNWEIAVSSREESYTDLFKELWDNSEPVTIKQLDEKYKEISHNKINNGVEEDYEDRWELPAEMCKESNYESFYRAFNELAEMYKPYRQWKETPLKFEIDSFLNYLFHEEEKPSYKYYKCTVYRQLSLDEQKEQIKYWSERYHNWLKSENNKWDNEYYRVNNSKLAKEILITNFKTLDIDSFVNVMENSVESYKSMNEWLDREKDIRKNDISDIKKFLETLFTSKLNKIDKITANTDIRGVGKSAALELLGLCIDEFPLRNQNVNSGLRFLGFNV